MKVLVTLHGEATPLDPSTGDVARALERHLTEVMEQLCDLEEADPAVSTPDISAQLATGTVDVSVVVEADSLEDAAAKGLATIRCAVHAAGGYTPGWETGEEPDWHLEVISSSQERLETTVA